MRLTNSVPESVKSTKLYRGARAALHFRQSDAYRRLRQRFRRDYRKIDTYLASTADPKLHFGCGQNPLQGWLNTDYYPDDASIAHIDLTRRFPLPTNCAALVFSEHVIEHLPLSGGFNMLRECFRVLQPGGRIRISTPSLPALLAIYHRPDEPAHKAYLDWHGATWLGLVELITPAVVLNDFMRNWGHLLVYDPETLGRMIAGVGFEQIRQCGLQQSEEPLLTGLENDSRMPVGLLALHTMVFEATKPQTGKV